MSTHCNFLLLVISQTQSNSQQLKGLKYVSSFNISLFAILLLTSAHSLTAHLIPHLNRLDSFISIDGDESSKSPSGKGRARGQSLSGSNSLRHSHTTPFFQRPVPYTFFQHSC